MKPPRPSGRVADLWLWSGDGGIVSEIVRGGGVIGFTERTPEQFGAEVRAMSDDELIAYGRQLRSLVFPQTVSGIGPCMLEIEYGIAKAEWRRHPTNVELIRFKKRCHMAVQARERSLSDSAVVCEFAGHVVPTGNL